MTSIIHTILALRSIHGIGNIRVNRIIESLPSRAQTLKDAIAHALSIGEITRSLQPEEVENATRLADSVIDDAVNNALRILHPWDGGDYPPALLPLSDRPPVLFVKGSLDCLHRPAIAVVGSRKASDKGLKIAHRIGKRAVQSGFTVVSGLARGCDTYGHMGAIDGNGKTVAVLPNGLGRAIYPPENTDLADRILSTGGMLLTEYNPATAPMRPHFTARDRIQSGLSKAVLMIEAPIHSGTMHTMEYARKQGRTTAAIDPVLLGDDADSSGNAAVLDRDGLYRGRLISETGDFKDFLAVCRGENKHKAHETYQGVQQTLF